MQNQEQKTVYIFFNEITKWLGEKGFFNDRGWKNESEGMGFYSFSKGKFRVNIKTDWNLKYDWYNPIEVQFIDCEKESYNNGTNGYIGWTGQKILFSLNKPFSKQMFDNLCEYCGF